MPENLSSIVDSTESTLLTTGWGRTEGPLWHAAGWLCCMNHPGEAVVPGTARSDDCIGLWTA